MARIPYGISDFASVRSEGYYYVDRSPYLRELEALGEKYLVFLRPRRFGKSLWISLLEHYYGQEHQAQFGRLFGELAIGKQPTSLANQYLVLRFDFSQIETSSPAATKQGFFDNVTRGISSFFGTYASLFDEGDRSYVLEAGGATQMLKRLFERHHTKQISARMYLLIDEYDHFTNELISLNLTHFQEIVTQNGWVRKFYETIKTGTGQGVVDRIFMTGVSPITLDSLTSGFNISTNLSLDPRFHNLMGFLSEEITDLMQAVGVNEAQLPALLSDLQQWYNGYGFSAEVAGSPLYNPDMVLYFAKEYQHRQAYPPRMLDTNIASDYGKIRKLFRLGGKEAENFHLLQQLLDHGSLTTYLTEEFSFEKEFSQTDFLSLLYYMGLLTIKGNRLGVPKLAIPNTVIQKLYFDYFRDLMRQQLTQLPEELRVQNIVLELAESNDPKPLMALISETLQQLSNRDWIPFNENSLKVILVSYLHSSQLYFIRSEQEFQQQYVDLLLLRRSPFPAPYQFAFELKYLKKKEAGKLAATIEEGRAQLQTYLQHPELAHLPDLRAWLIVFVGTELACLEAVG